MDNLHIIILGPKNLFDLGYGLKVNKKKVHLQQQQQKKSLIIRVGWVLYQCKQLIGRDFWTVGLIFTKVGYCLGFFDTGT